MKTLIRFFALISAVCLFSCASTPAKKDKPKKTLKMPVKAPKILSEGDIIPDFTLPDVVTGEQFSFNNDIKGKSKVIAITFFTPACLSCKAEMELLKELAEKHGDDLKVYAVKEIFKENDKKVPISSDKIKFLLDDNWSLLMNFGFGFAPSLVVADGDGKILYLKEGYSKKDNYYITKSIKEAVETEE